MCPLSPKDQLNITSSETVLVLAPTGRDASLIREVLLKNGLSAEICSTVQILCERMKQPLGALIVAEEALNGQSVQAINQVLSEQEPWSDLPFILMTSHGEATLESLNTIRALWSSGHVMLLERPFRTITLINSLKVALRSRRRQYQVRDLLQKQIEATRLRDEFISIASHELKTPLTTMKLQLQFNHRLQTSEPSMMDERVRKMVLTFNHQVDRLSRLVEDMLDVSRVNTGKLIIQKEKMDLSGLVREVVERFQPQIEVAQNKLTIEASKPVVGNWDRYRIEQVISNLLTNALRYAAGKPVNISVKEENGLAILTVQDFGNGIAPENQERIFDRFERAVTSGNISGLGLGLFICREIVERHGGSIRVDSRLGEGATFRVSLPTQ